MLKQLGWILPRRWPRGSTSKDISALRSHPLGKSPGDLTGKAGTRQLQHREKPHSKETGQMVKNKKRTREEREVTHTCKFRTAAKQAHRGGKKLSMGLWIINYIENRGIYKSKEYVEIHILLVERFFRSFTRIQFKNPRKRAWQSKPTQQDKGARVKVSESSN